MKKQIIAAAAAAMICVGAIGGTFAYLTSGPATVTNTFTVGAGVKFEEDLNGGLDEAKVDELGAPVTPAERVTANEYKLIPGHEYTKDPTVHIADDSDDCYVFIKVENGIAGIEAASNTIASQIATKWTAVPDHDGYYYWAAGAIAADATDKDLVVFENFTVDSAKTNEELGDFADAEIVIKACAVQADGFASAVDAVVAWPTGF